MRNELLTNEDRVQEARPINGSFRDRAGHVFDIEGRIIRGVSAKGARAFNELISNGALNILEDEGWLIGTKQLAQAPPKFPAEAYPIALEHERVPFVSYPYEWCFSQLKAAALFHLSFHLRALELGFTLNDGTPFNIQFIGRRPKFIDTLSLVPYEEGRPWAGYRQFCMLFLNPLLIESFGGLAAHRSLRAGLEGLGSQETSALAPLTSKFSLAYWMHLHIPARLERAAIRNSKKISEKAAEAQLPKSGLIFMLRQLRRLITRLKSSAENHSVWRNYNCKSSYSDAGEAFKIDFVQNAVCKAKPALLFDLGCNTGLYSMTALASGAGYVVGSDNDLGAIARAFDASSYDQDQWFLPLVQDLADPSPSLGWLERERPSFLERAKGDFVLALALIHHLAIGRNLPLAQILDMLLNIAPRGIIEFVPKSDDQTQQLLLLRDDIFDDYCFENFMMILEEKNLQLQCAEVPGSKRTLIYYQA